MSHSLIRMSPQPYLVRNRERMLFRNPPLSTLLRAVGLLEEKRGILIKALELVEALYKKGAANTNPVLLATLRVLEVILELSETPKKRLEVLNEILAMSTSAEERALQMEKQGAVSQGSAAEATLKRLDAQIAFEREKSAMEAAEKPGHMDGRATRSFQFFDRAGAAALTVSLNFGGPISPERETLFDELRKRFERA